MNNKHKKTLKAIFANPIRRNIAWNDVLSLVEGLGGKVEPGTGSKVQFELNGIVVNLHSPHPGNELKKYQVKLIRKLLEEAGYEI